MSEGINAYMKSMLDSIPICCTFWDETCKIIYCNKEALLLFGLTEKQQFADKFLELCPVYQPDGTLSSEKIAQMVKQAFATDERVSFEWFHKTSDDTIIPTEMTLIRMEVSGAYIVGGYTFDLREITETLSKLNHMERLAFTDSLTGICNRLRFFETAEREFQNNCSDIAIVMFDIDRFKKINDTYGHIVGDVVLKTIVRRIQGVLRPCDLFARYGGEEFVVLLMNCKLAAAIEVATRMRLAICSEDFIYKDLQFNVSASFGVSIRLSENCALTDVISRADTALYKAKGSGRNKVEFL